MIKMRCCDNEHFEDEMITMKKKMDKDDDEMMTTR